MRGRGRERGQATVELALLLPVVAVLLLAVVQAGLVARGAVLTVQAAREAARAAAVGDDPAGGVRLPSDRTSISVRPDGEHLVVVVRYRQVTDVPLVGALVGDVAHHQTIVIRAER